MFLLVIFIFSISAAYFVRESGPVVSDDVIITTYHIQAVPKEMINK